MNDLIQHTTEAKLQESAGSEFSLVKKLQIGGTGSMKMIHLEGIEFIDKFESTSKSHHYLSFELRPHSLIGRTYGNEIKTFFITKETVSSIEFETYNLRIATKRSVVIRHEGILRIELIQQTIKLYVPSTAYKPVKKFFEKDWLNDKTTFKVSSSKPEVNYTALIADIITRLIG